MHKYYNYSQYSHSTLSCLYYLDFSGTDPETVARMKDLWMLKHRHQHEGPRKVGDGKLTTVIKDLLVQKLESKASGFMTELGKIAKKLI